MYRVFTIVSLALLILSCGSGNNSQPPVNNDLVQLENDWMHAMMKRDQTKLEELMGAEFSMTGMKYIDSAAVPRNIWMHNALQDLKVDSLHIITAKLTTINNVGIIRASIFWSGSYGNDHFADTSMFVDTWMKKDNGWQVVNRIVTN